MYIMHVRKNAIAGARLWTMGFSLGSAGMFTFFFRGILPDLLTITLGNVLLFYTEALIYNGTRKFLHEKLITKTQWSVMAFSVLSITAFNIYFTEVNNNIGMRIAANNAFLAIIAFLFSYGIASKKCLSPRNALAIAYAMYGIISFLFALYGFSFLMKSNDFLQLGPVTAFFVVSYALMTIIFIGIIVMLINDGKHACLKKESLTDPLTGAGNRRLLNTYTKHYIARLQRMGEPLVILLLDIDRFKSINDNYGHDAGDAVLQHFCNIVSTELRCMDRLFRYGGEEFVALLQPAGSHAAQVAAERIREAVEASQAKYGDTPIPLTVSIGIANVMADEPDLSMALVRADKALYRAKQTGRNKVESNYLPSASSSAAGTSPDSPQQ